MSFILFLTTGLKAFACFWALVTFSVAAAFVSRTNNFFGSSYVKSTHLTAGNAIIAAGVLAFLYFFGVLAMTVVRRENILISVMVDTIILSALFILFLGSAAALSTLASLASRFDSYYSWARLGEATLGLAWVMTFLILGILVFEVVYTLTHFGGAFATWRTPFNHLVAYSRGPSAGAGLSTKHQTPAAAAPMATTGHAPVAATGTGAGTGTGVSGKEHNYQLAPSQPRGVGGGTQAIGTVNPQAANRV
ncbi:hypothetical protein IAR50_006313 [Cryptococcus sp. DSM 104548]